MVTTGDFAQDHETLKRRDSGSFRAVILSLCTHSLILAPLTTITWHLAEHPPAPLEVSIVQIPEPQPQPQPPAPQPEVQAKPQPQPKAAPRPVHHPAPKTPVTVPELTALPHAGSVTETTEATETVIASAPAPAQSTSSGTTVENRQSEISTYKMIVWEQIQNHRPSHVRLSGTSVVLFSITPNGTLQKVEIWTPSGKAFLDQTALDIVESAAPFPPPPGTATAQDLTFIIPFEFR